MRSVAIMVLLSACTLDSIDLEDRFCPCATGWTCIDDTCVRDGDAALADSGADAAADAARDAGADASDSGRDVGADAPTPDASADAGTDASTDGGTDDVGADVPLDVPPPDPTACDDEFDMAIFCDGFETDLTAWDTTIELSGTVMRTEAPPVYRGTGALFAQTTAPSGKASTVKDFPPVANGTLHLRGYFYIPTAPAVGTVSFFFAGESDPPNVGAGIQLTSDGRTQVYNGVEDVLVAGVRPVFPRDTWVCVTMEIDVGMNGGITAAADGVTIADESSIDTRPLGGIGRIIAGVEFSNAATSAAIVRADEVVVSRTPIGCD